MQPQQKLKNPPVQVQDDQYNYDDINNYYHNKNYRGQPRAHRPYRGQNTGQFLEVKICMAEVNAIKMHTKANIKTMVIKAIIIKAIEVYIITHVEIFNRAIIMANLEAEDMVMAEVITMAVAAAGPIIEVMLIINTISIMVMMMSTRQINMVHHVHYAVAIIAPLNIVLRENIISMILWKR